MGVVMNKEGTEIVHDPVGRNPFLQMIGLELLEAAGGKSRFILREQAHLKNIWGVAHGGVIMTLMDAGMASAALSVVNFTKALVTIDMSISFIRPGAGELHIVGKATGGGNSVCFCDAEITDHAGELVAKAIGSFKYRSRPSAKNDE